MAKPLLERLEPEMVSGLTDRELAALLAELWTDPYIRGNLHGSSTFVADRIRSFAARGYYTARERQGILRTFFANNFDIRRRVQRAILRRQAAGENETHVDGGR